jgi:hypothetical protein
MKQAAYENHPQTTEQLEVNIKIQQTHYCPTFGQHLRKPTTKGPSLYRCECGTGSTPKEIATSVTKVSISVTLYTNRSTHSTNLLLNKSIAKSMHVPFMRAFQPETVFIDFELCF